MLDPALLAAIRGLFKARAIEVRDQTCLNRRHKDAGCRRCADACPTQAITLVDGRPQLAEPQCVNCGACLQACPTDVFVLLPSAESKLLQNHVELPLQALGLICPLHPAPTESQLPVSRVLRHSRCLAGFSALHLLELAADGARPLWLDDSHCPDCPIGQAHASISQATTAANQLLAACGRPAAIHTHQQEGGQGPAHAVGVLEGDQPELSRRGFFRVLGGRLRQQTADAIDHSAAPTPDKPLPVSERLPQRQPVSGQRLNARLAAMARASAGMPVDLDLPTAALPFGNVLIDAPRCSACGLCARFCPTGALRFETHEPGAGDQAAQPTFELSFRTNLCIDCNICVVACPEQAVSMGESLPAPSLFEATWRSQATGAVAQCKQCKTLTRRPEGEATTALCSVCRRTSGDARQPGLFADLFPDLFPPPPEP